MHDTEMLRNFVDSPPQQEETPQSFVNSSTSLTPDQVVWDSAFAFGLLLEESLVWAEDKFNVGTKRLIVCSQPDRSTSSLVCGRNTIDQSSHGNLLASRQPSADRAPSAARERPRRFASACLSALWPRVKRFAVSRLQTGACCTCERRVTRQLSGIEAAHPPASRRPLATSPWNASLALTTPFPFSPLPSHILGAPVLRLTTAHSGSSSDTVSAAAESILWLAQPQSLYLPFIENFNISLHGVYPVPLPSNSALHGEIRQLQYLKTSAYLEPFPAFEVEDDGSYKGDTATCMNPTHIQVDTRKSAIIPDMRKHSDTAGISWDKRTSYATHTACLLAGKYRPACRLPRTAAGCLLHNNVKSPAGSTAFIMSGVVGTVLVGLRILYSRAQLLKFPAWLKESCTTTCKAPTTGNWQVGRRICRHSLSPAVPTSPVVSIPGEKSQVLSYSDASVITYALSSGKTIGSAIKLVNLQYIRDVRSRNQQPERSRDKLNVLRPLTDLDGSQQPANESQWWAIEGGVNGKSQRKPTDQRHLTRPGNEPGSPWWEPSRLTGRYTKPKRTVVTAGRGRAGTPGVQTPASGTTRSVADDASSPRVICGAGPQIHARSVRIIITTYLTHMPTKWRCCSATCWIGATETERFACSPPSNATHVQYTAGSRRIFARANRAGRCRWSAGFLGDLPFPALSSEVLRDDQVSMEQHRNERAGRNCRSPRKLVDQWHRPARFTHAKLRESQCLGIEPGLPWWEVTRLTTQSPNSPHVLATTPQRNLPEKGSKTYAKTTEACFEHGAALVSGSQALFPFLRECKSSSHFFCAAENHRSTISGSLKRSSVARPCEGRGKAVGANPILASTPVVWLLVLLQGEEGEEGWEFPGGLGGVMRYDQQGGVSGIVVRVIGRFGKAEGGRGRRVGWGVTYRHKLKKFLLSLALAVGKSTRRRGKLRDLDA
ncbi:hypothetical protein PR048_001456 [Dryococelus australis]|uniref:Uncharacterized protein n=1 Tax=Dryococelus australis TaxID=614101 RepID=A0ABQ9IHJ1_9NEOP|nr:hypothetical protein PR048_001456 [Dryococelus australis]